MSSTSNNAGNIVAYDISRFLVNSGKDSEVPCV